MFRGRLTVLALAGLVALGSCRRKTDSTVTLPADAGLVAPGATSPR